MIKGGLEWNEDTYQKTIGWFDDKCMGLGEYAHRYADINYSNQIINILGNFMKKNQDE